MAEKNVQNDFSKGNIPAVVMRMALPLIAAQLVNVLYNVVDRIYIGHIPNVGSMALTGVGIALPVISILSAFAGLFGQGGAPLCSMARGRGDNDEASRVMGNAFSMLLVSSVALGLLTWAFLDPVITVFAAGKEASSYAREYLAVYLIGTTFSFVSLGMNVYINAQGFATRGMLTVLLGAAANIVLDPLFIFAFRMGVRGAAAATVLSQALSAAWCFLFLRSDKTPLELSWRTMAPRKKIMGRIMSLGVADFVMGATNSAIQTVANRQLGLYGGDLYVGAITVVNSLRTIFTEIIHGFGSGIQPVLLTTARGRKSVCWRRSGSARSARRCFRCSCGRCSCSSPNRSSASLRRMRSSSPWRCAPCAFISAGSCSCRSNLLRKTRSARSARRGRRSSFRCCARSCSSCR